MLYRKCEKQNSKDKIQEADQNTLSLLGNNMVFKASAAALENIWALAQLMDALCRCSCFHSAAALLRSIKKQ